MRPSSSGAHTSSPVGSVGDVISPVYVAYRGGVQSVHRAGDKVAGAGRETFRASVLSAVLSVSLSKTSVDNVEEYRALVAVII